MVKLSVCCGLLVLAFTPVGQVQPNAAAVVEGLQRVAGGAAVAAVRSLSISAVRSRHIAGHTSMASVEYQCELPDRCVTFRAIDDLPFRTGSEVDGFAGDLLISRRVGNIPYPPDP